MEHTYTTQQGDTWDIIARNAYGTEMLAGHLQEANPGYTRLLYFPAGIVLAIPEPPATASLASEAPWKRGKLLSELPNVVGEQIIPAGVYGSGTQNHGELKGREDPNQHPLSAIMWGNRPMDAVMQEVFKRLDAMKAGIEDAPKDGKLYGRRDGAWAEASENDVGGDGEDGEGDDSRPAGQTLYFTADGAALTHSLAHKLGTKNLVVQAFDDATDKRIASIPLSVTVDAFALETDVPLPAGTRVRVVAIATDIAGGGYECCSGNAAGQTLSFEADGASLKYTLEHTLGTKNLVVQTYDDSTDKYIAITEISTTPDAVVIETDVPLPAGIRVRVPILATDVVMVSRYEHKQSAAEKNWVIPHNLGNKRPVVLVFDENGDEVISKKDYRNATLNSITVTHHNAMAGRAVVYSILGRLRHDHTQAVAEKNWVIQHNLGNTRPIVMVFDDAGDEVVCGKDFANATPDSITVTPGNAMTGTAVVCSLPIK